MERPRRWFFLVTLVIVIRVLMRPPANLAEADVVLMEGTYGNRTHRSMDATIEQLSQVLADTWARHGNVMIPSFCRRPNSGDSVLFGPPASRG